MHGVGIVVHGNSDEEAIPCLIYHLRAWNESMQALAALFSANRQSTIRELRDHLGRSLQLSLLGPSMLITLAYMLVVQA